MTQLLKINQVGLPAGVPGVSRTDGRSGGQTVTLTNTAPGTVPTMFRLLWVPPGDTTAAESLAGTDKVWTFSPTPGVYGSYLIELIVSEGTTSETRERRVFAIRTPGRRLVIPAHGERGDRTAWLGDTDAENVDNNAVDYDAPLDAVPYAGWWRALQELYSAVDGIVVPLSPATPEDEGKFVGVDGDGNYALYDAGGGGGGSLPDGTVEGAPLIWDPFAGGWVEGSYVVVSQVVGADDGWDNGLSLNSGSGGLAGASGIYLGSFAQVEATNDIRIEVNSGGHYNLYGSTQTTQHGFTVTKNFGSTRIEALLLGTAAGYYGTGAAVGFFGAPLAPKQRIAGTTTQEQISSVVAALVAFGLVADARTPP